MRTRDDAVQQNRRREIVAHTRQRIPPESRVGETDIDSNQGAGTRCLLRDVSHVFAVRSRARHYYGDGDAVIE
jgi:hypothetical protein